LQYITSIQQSISQRGLARASFSRQGRKEKALAIKIDPEEMHLIGREAYICFPNGPGAIQILMAGHQAALGTSGTGCNWNSATKMLEMAEKIAPG